jgi:phospholipid-translocating ATPase
MWSYWINILDAVWQNAVIFFVAYFAYSTDSDIDVSSFGFSIATSMMVTSLIHVLLQTSRVDLSMISAVAFSLLVFLGFTLIFDATCVTCLPGESPYQVSYHTLRQGCFWFTNLFTIVVAMLPRFAIKCVYNSMRNPLM